MIIIIIGIYNAQTYPAQGAENGILVSKWINGWVNNREAVELRYHCAYYDVIVMKLQI